MSQPRCRPGDLAIVIEAHNPDNIGRVVQVLRLHDGTGPLAMQDAGVVWEISATTPMTWSKNGRSFTLSEGPCPDRQLQPIRGTGPDHSKGRQIQRPVGEPVTA